jgi:uncharacterized RDD family membrane protein YckC
LPCSECGAILNTDLAEEVHLSQTDVEEPVTTRNTQKAKPARSLIEFPGAKSSKPQWRKELGERVREVQEKRAREAMAEAGLTDAEVDENESKIPLLELLPRTETPPVNPIVAAALQRIERANVQPRYSRHGAAATMLAYDEPSEYGLEVSAPSPDGSFVSLQEEPDLMSARPERTHNLAVVPPQIFSDPVLCEFEPVAAPVIEEPPAPEPARKPKRLIGDLNDPALNYLDSIPVAICLETDQRRSAPVFFRMLGAILDLVFVCLLSSPVVALVKLTDLKWQDSRTIGFAIGTYIVVGFLYLTITTAFTGRTLGMKLFSLRVVDARTGLIPTGGQSVARALIYILSIASAGIALIYTLLNSDKHAAHDRLTRTAVVRV